MKKLTRDTTALVKDLELQIDYLIGYSPNSQHWKREYHMRQLLLDNTLCSNDTPQEIVDKINRIQESLYNLRNANKHKQGYIFYSEMDYELDHKILVNDRQHNESYYI